jgi:acyl-CoA thioester hydrolase
VVRHHEITYALAAKFGDELELTTEVERIRGARAVRHTSIRRGGDGSLVVDMRTEWVWVRLADGRPSRIPESVVAAFGAIELGSPIKG